MTDELITHGIEGIAAITSALLAHQSGTLTSEQLAAELMKVHSDSLAHIDALHIALVKDREAADKALHDRFDQETKPE